LDTFAVPFRDFHVDAYRIAGTECGQIGAKLFLRDFLNQMMHALPLLPTDVHAAKTAAAEHRDPVKAIFTTTVIIA